jgi:arylsulfatase A-like enzyme
MMQSQFLKDGCWLLSLGLLLVSGAGCSAPTPVSPPNILFISVDDLRPELGAYGASYMHTPNIDRLAGTAVQFNRAYCQVPVCGASRASVLTGAYPARYRFLSARTRAEEDYPEAIPLHTYFRQQGYQTYSIGKVFDRSDDHLNGWSVPPERFQGRLRWADYQSEENRSLDSLHQLGLPWERLDLPDTAYFDGKIANLAIARLKQLQAQEQPFFLATGFLKPHLPFTPPARYWDMYDPGAIELPGHKVYHPENAPVEAFHPWTELLAYYGVPEGPLPDSIARKLIHGYFASVSYVDAQVGRVLDALEEYGLADNTIVVLWGDHGWYLGDHGMWCKKFNFLEAQHVPLLLRAPGYSPDTTNAVVDHVDLYPTLCDLAGLPGPEHLIGQSLKPQLEAPAAESTGFAFSKWEDGLSLITRDYAYTVWMPAPDSIAARMLFDLRSDPKQMNNLAGQQGYQELSDSLHQQLLSIRGADFDTPVPGD